MAGTDAVRTGTFRLEPRRGRTVGGAALLAGFVLLGAPLPAAAKSATDPLAQALAGQAQPADREGVLTAQYYRDRTNDRRWRDDDDDDDGNRNRRLRRSRRQRDDDDD